MARLVRSPICPAEDASQYADELRKLAEMTIDETSIKNECRFFKALADENRIRILKLLMLREMCVCEIMFALNLTQPTTSHHLGILEKSGIIQKRKQGKWAYYSVIDLKAIEGMKRLMLLK